jgi:hypothetical protein
MPATATDVVWTPVCKCTCCTKRCTLQQLPTTNPMHTHKASIWDGIEFKEIEHGTKQCPSCHVRYKLNFISRVGVKQNCLDSATISDDSIILVHVHLGFTYRSLHLLWQRVCRGSISFLAEASSILLANPGVKVGHTAKNRYNNNESITDANLAHHLQTALFNYLRFQDKTYNFEVDNVVPDGDPVFDVTLEDVHLIYNEPQIDLHLKRYGKVDIVTDGNQPLSRILCDDEKKGLKRLQGRPKENKSKNNEKNSSRCISVSSAEKIVVSRSRTGGLFVSMSMHTVKKGHGNQILQLAEIKNSECKAYKKKLLKALIKKKCNNKRVKVGKYTHDVGCGVKEFEDGLCEKVHLDAYHGEKHKCDTAVVTKEKHPGLNSQAAEQLWSKLEHLQPTISHMTRPNYRFFLRHICSWRNNFVVKQWKKDVCPAVSRRRAQKRRLKSFRSNCLLIVNRMLQCLFLIDHTSQCLLLVDRLHCKGAH